MPLTNAEKQARYRARQAAELERLRKGQLSPKATKKLADITRNYLRSVESLSQMSPRTKKKLIQLGNRYIEQIEAPTNDE